MFTLKNLKLKIIVHKGVFTIKKDFIILLILSIFITIPEIVFSNEKCFFNCDLQNLSKKQKNKNPSVNIPSFDKEVDGERCKVIKSSIKINRFNNVEVICDKDYAYIISNTIPNHKTMNGIVSTNEQIPVPSDNYISPIKLYPKISSTNLTRDAALGVAINGVPIYDYSAQGEINLHHYNPKKDTYILGQLDNCGGHAGRGDDYHYHKKPICMIKNIKNKRHDTIIGWGYDGYPLYDDLNLDGTKISKLGLCNGKVDPIYGYRYHTSSKQPYIFKCLVGRVDTKILQRIPPLKGSRIRMNLKPPKGGVYDLTFNVQNDISLMSYKYNGRDYFISYTSIISRKGCYQFKQKTINNNGILEEAVLCR